MNWLFVALLAQSVLGTSALADKLLLKKSYPNPVGYTFWLGILGLASIILLPFGFEGISSIFAAHAFAAGILFLLGMLFYFYALFHGKTAAAIVATAGFTPLATLLLSALFLGIKLAPYQLASFLFLVGGGFLLAFFEKREFRARTIFLSLLAALFLGASNILSKLVFEETNFVTGFFWIKVASALAALCFLLYPAWRWRIFAPAATEAFRDKAEYLFNRAYAGVGSLLVFYALSLGVPPLVSATESIKFLIVIIGGWLLLHEKINLRAMLKELAAFGLIACAVIALGVGDYLASTKPNPDRSIMWGVTFSQKYASDFGDWRQIYRAMFTELRVKHLRLIAYWDLMEPERDKYNFEGLDFQMDIARAEGAEIILAVGQKVPRWPECHLPGWAKELNEEERQKEFEMFLESVVKKYKENRALEMWQVENEPFLRFGDCGTRGKVSLDSEIELVRKLDPERPILVTDSGEFGFWPRAAKQGDVFGTTMYRRVHNKVFGYIDYHLPPQFFRLKEAFTRAVTGEGTKKFMVIELATEPWLAKGLREAMPEETERLFDEAFFRDTILYAKETGFSEYYLWGVEWWWWMKEHHHQPTFWEIGKELLQQ